MTDTDYADLIRRLRDDVTLPFCPYDRRSPEYWTTNDTDPCRICGEENDFDAPPKCTGADSRIMKEAADALAALVKERDEALLKQVCDDWINDKNRHYQRGLRDGERKGLEDAFMCARGYDEVQGRIRQRMNHLRSLITSEGQSDGV